MASVINPPDIITPTQWKWLYIEASGGEQNLSTPLVDNFVNKLTRDGKTYRKVDGNPTGKEFEYDSQTGQILFDPSLPPMEVAETVAIQYLLAFDAPIISNVSVSSITDTSVTINWTTGILSDSTVEYWITPGSVFQETDPTLVTSHSISITGLIAGTTYTFHVISVDAGGNTYTSTDYTFTTTGGTAPPDTTPPVISNVQSDPSYASVIISWDTNEAANSRVEYGLTTGYGSQTTLVSTLVLNHSVLITGLTANTTYHFRVKSADAAGNLATSGDFSFVTTSAPPPGTTTYGVIIVQTSTTLDQRLIVAQNMGVNHWRGGHESVSAYHGQGSITYNKLKAKGMKYIMNANWNAVSSPTGQFAHVESTYKSQLNWILNDYAADRSVVEIVVIENEPTNDNYYGDTMANYIQELGWAIEVVHAKGQKVADGCCHVELILGVKSGLRSANFGQVDQILTGINNLRISGKVLDYCNMHTPVKDTTPAAGDIAEAAQYVRDRTGIQNIIMNEFAFHTTASARAINMMQQTKEANLLFAVPFGGEYPPKSASGGGSAQPFNNQLVLTALGSTVAGQIALP